MLKKVANPNEDTEAEKVLRNFVSQTFIVYMKIYALHWNFIGPRFHSVHVMTENQYKNMAEAIDELAERMRALGTVAPVSLMQILEHSSIQEYKSHADDESSLKELAKDHRALSVLAKKAADVAAEADDTYTHDILIQRAGTHDKFAWMIESLAQ